MKTCYITAFCLLLAGCVLEKETEVDYYLDDHYFSLLDVDLQPGVRALTIDIFEATQTGSRVEAGKLLAKDDYEFTPVGLCSKKISYTIQPSGDYRESDMFTYAFDEKTRITREVQTRYPRDGAPDTLVTVTTYLYNDKEGTATCHEYAGKISDEEKDYLPVSKKVYPLDETGHIYWGLADMYTPSRADAPGIYYKRIILHSDNRGNWTESYLQEEHDINSSAFAAAYDYTKRYITYY
ncbi:MAG: hypothetical protein LBK12_01545 [Odoribacteraceae bacterium]|jgi:hypothetical protein|nr:hypothetical protein [Odoribacteraceae bacterium]